jgi:antitoxin YefM
MSSVLIAQAKARLSELVDEAERTHERVTITRHGKPVAIIVSVDDIEALEDMVFWLSQPGIQDDIAKARRAREAGELLGVDEVRRRLGLPRRS